jgi:hypothetical protein
MSVTISNDAGAATTDAYGLASVTGPIPARRTPRPSTRSTAKRPSLTRSPTGTWTCTYRSDGQPSTGAPPAGWGSATALSYDAAGSLTGLATTNATFTHTANRAGHRISETAMVAGDPQNGTATFGAQPALPPRGYVGTGVPSVVSEARFGSACHVAATVRIPGRLVRHARGTVETVVSRPSRSAASKVGRAATDFASDPGGIMYCPAVYGFRKQYHGAPPVGMTHTSLIHLVSAPKYVSALVRGPSIR